FALGVVDSHDVIGAHVATAPNAELKTTLADLVHRGGFLGNAQGVDQGQHLDGHAHPEPFGTGRNGTGHHDRRRQDRAVRIEMRLTQPGGIHAHRVGQVYQLKRFLETLVVGATSADCKVHIDTKVHTWPPDCHCDRGCVCTTSHGSGAVSCGALYTFSR